MSGIGMNIADDLSSLFREMASEFLRETVGPKDEIFCVGMRVQAFKERLLDCIWVFRYRCTVFLNKFTVYEIEDGFLDIGALKAHLVVPTVFPVSPVDSKRIGN